MVVSCRHSNAAPSKWDARSFLSTKQLHSEQQSGNRQVAASTKAKGEHLTARRELTYVQVRHEGEQWGTRRQTSLVAVLFPKPLVPQRPEFEQFEHRGRSRLH